MSTQTFVKRGKPYVAHLALDSDVDQDGPDYQIWVGMNHEWSSSLFPSVRLTSPVTPGDETLQVTDGSRLTAGKLLIYGSGPTEYSIIASIDENLVTLENPVTGNHRLNCIVSELSRATRDGVGEYSYTFSESQLLSSGQYHLRWIYIQDSLPIFIDRFIEVYQPYITASEFFDLHPELESVWDDNFDSVERLIRNKINTYCGQNFDYFSNKTQIFDGNNKKTLDVGMRLANIDQVIMYPDVDITNDVNIANNTHRFIALRSTDNISKFSCKREFEITGDWGWESVPVHVTQAAEILLMEHMDESSAIKKHGVKHMQMDSESITFSDNITDSTGNLDADVLLLDYTIFVMGIV